MGKLPTRRYRPLYLAEWIEATGRDISGAAAAGEVMPSYISNIIAGRKHNPSAHVLVLVSEYLGITVNDLYRRPPTGAALDALSSLSTAARETLSKSRRG